MPDRIHLGRESAIVRGLDGAARDDDARRLHFVGKVASLGGQGGAPPYYVAVNPVQVTGNDAEGGVVGYGVDATQSVAVAILNGTAAVGDYLICHAVSEGRWAAEKSGTAGTGGGTTGSIPYPGCYCDIPRTLAMTSQNTTCNFKYFQNATLQYGPVPAAFGGSLGFRCGWFSTAEFFDETTNSSFYYQFSCNQNQFYITQVYPNFEGGGLNRSGAIYTWLVGTTGNACNPFLLTNGSPYQGSSCFPPANVKIDGTVSQVSVPGC